VTLALDAQTRVRGGKVAVGKRAVAVARDGKALLVRVKG
jgi:hypothetical protein